MEPFRVRTGLVLVVVASALAGGCELFNPERPTMQPDTVVFGNLLEVGEPADGGRLVTVRVGVPRALAKAETVEGKPTPVVEPGLTAEVTVTADTVVLHNGGPARLDEFDPGSEVVALPLAGTTSMVGASRVLFEAAYFLDFDTYREWQLPGLGLPDEGPGDPDRINSPGVEQAPVPVAGGRVLYFTYRLRQPPVAGGDWIGPVRPGLPGSEEIAGDRAFRTELGEDGWTPPRLVQMPGVQDAVAMRISWVSDDETRCLVTVWPPGGPPWVGLASRTTASEPWGEPQPIEALDGADAADAVYLAGSRTKLVFVSRRDGSRGADLYLYDPAVPETPLPLEPRINTVADETGPRIGPVGELFFTRADRQLLLAGGEITPVRLPSPYRVVITGAAPTDDGEWVFFCSPRYRPVELDLDIWVAPWEEGGRLGPAVPVDEWRPAG